jgi:AcrR family transcriptional regulator
MKRKEEIIYAALELASEHGSSAVTLGMIADRVGIKKPSLYNHFSSKEEILNAMYSFLREEAQKRKPLSSDNPAEIKEKSLKALLMDSLTDYIGFLSDKDILSFFRLLYSERSLSPGAAQIMTEETERMISSTKNFFYSLVVHGKMKNEDVDTAALSYAMTIHSLVDRQLDLMTAENKKLSPPEISEDMKNYIRI